MQIGQYWISKQEPTVVEIKSLESDCVKFRVIGMDREGTSAKYMIPFFEGTILSEQTEKFIENFKYEREK